MTATHTASSQVDKTSTACLPMYPHLARHYCTHYIFGYDTLRRISGLHWVCDIDQNPGIGIIGLQNKVSNALSFYLRQTRRKKCSVKGQHVNAGDEFHEVKNIKGENLEMEYQA